MSAMWIGRLDRLDPPPDRSASCSIECTSPRSSRFLEMSRSRKNSRSRLPSPAWFFPEPPEDAGAGAGCLLTCDPTGCEPGFEFDEDLAATFAGFSGLRATGRATGAAVRALVVDLSGL